MKERLKVLLKKKKKKILKDAAEASPGEGNTIRGD